MLGDFKVKKDQSKIEGSGNYIVVPIGTVTEAIISENLLPKELLFRIVPDDAQRMPVILGRRFTNACNIAYHRVGDALTFEHLDDSMFQAEEEGVRPVCLENTILQPDEVRFISMRVDNISVELPVHNECERLKLRVERGCVRKYTKFVRYQRLMKEKSLL